MRDYNIYAYELLAHLRHLALAGQDEEGELEWVGSERQWENTRDEIKDYEKNT